MTAIYHITHVANLVSVIKEVGLCCDNRRSRNGLTCKGIAYQHIKDRRAKRHVPLGLGGTLADYVPFYFAPRSPMLYTIDRDHVPNYSEGQRPVVHLVASAERVVAAGLACVFTDGHADMAYSEFFNDLSALDRVDWDIMKSQYWNDTADDGDRKRRRQAEFLVHDFLPAELVEEVGVFNSEMAEQVHAALASTHHRPRIVVHRDWYY